MKHRQNEYKQKAIEWSTHGREGAGDWLTRIYGSVKHACLNVKSTVKIVAKPMKFNKYVPALVSNRYF